MAEEGWGIIVCLSMYLNRLDKDGKGGRVGRGVVCVCVCVCVGEVLKLMHVAGVGLSTCPLVQASAVH